MINYLFIYPEIIISAGLCIIIIIDLFISANYKSISYYLIQIILAYCVYHIFSYSEFMNTNTSNLYDTSTFSNIFKVFIILILLLIFYYTSIFLKYFNKYKTEYFVISLFGLLGMMIMISSQHLLLLYLGIELLSLSLYSIIAFNKNSLFSSEAAVKYYILGAISSGFLLFGISLIYGLTGSLFYHEIIEQLSLLNVNPLENDMRILGLVFALTFIFISLSFKFGAAPFHMWIPDVYHGSMITTTLMLSTIPKIAVFIILIKLLGSVFSSLYIFWIDMLLILSILSLLIGNIIAISQKNIKRMLAYSTIANIGFIFLGISMGSIDSYKAAMFYTLTYVITTIGAFGLLSQLIYKNKPIEDIQELSGLSRNQPFPAFLLMVIMLSYIGIPPFIGFHAKLFVIQSLVHSEYIALGIFAVLMTVIGSYYYLRVIKVIYFDNESEELKSTSSYIVTGLYVIILILLGLFPDILGQLSGYSIANLFNT